MLRKSRNRTTGRLLWLCYLCSKVDELPHGCRVLVGRWLLSKRWVTDGRRILNWLERQKKDTHVNRAMSFFHIMFVANEENLKPKLLRSLALICPIYTHTHKRTEPRPLLSL